MIDPAKSVADIYNDGIYIDGVKIPGVVEDGAYISAADDEPFLTLRVGIFVGNVRRHEGKPPEQIAEDWAPETSPLAVENAGIDIEE